MCVCFVGFGLSREGEGIIELEREREGRVWVAVVAAASHVATQTSLRSVCVCRSIKSG